MSISTGTNSTQSCSDKHHDGECITFDTW